MTRLQSYPWPGNVRELENVLTQALVLARDDHIGIDDLQLRSASGIKGQSTTETLALRSLDEIEAEHVQRVLNHTQGHKGRSCEILGISRPALDRKIDKYQLTVPGRRD
jgi:DNA-binding NtrC family response regulator